MEAASKADFDRLEQMMQEFIEEYRLDMQGDKNAENGGRRGLVGSVREIRLHTKNYPSITWLLAKKPVKTGGIIVTIFFVLATLFHLGILAF